MAIRHISVFFLKERTMKNLDTLIRGLEQVGKEYPNLLNQAGEGILPDAMPPAGAGPAFGDVVHIIDFAAPADAAAYPASSAHLELMEKTNHLIDHVVAIDYQF